jgi:hypothetical protein
MRMPPREAAVMESQTPLQPRADADPIEVRVAFEPGTGPVSGFVGDGASPIRFHGWLELMDALDAARSSPPDGEHPERR